MVLSGNELQTNDAPVLAEELDAIARRHFEQIAAEVGQREGRPAVALVDELAILEANGARAEAAGEIGPPRLFPCRIEDPGELVCRIKHYREMTDHRKADIGERSWHREGDLGVFHGVRPDLDRTCQIPTKHVALAERRDSLSDGLGWSLER